jgi:ribosomal protein S18 acetylase RimI-like enzyme
MIFEGTTKQGNPLAIRYPQLTDVPKLTELINALSQERTFITYQGEAISQDQEERIIKYKLERIKNKQSVMLIALSKDEIVGVSSLDLGSLTGRHIGDFGISISKDFRGQGAGKILMEVVISEAKKIMSGLEIITLKVFAKNKTAIKMYEELGFKKYGQLPNGVKLENSYDDHIYMYKNING